MADRFRDDGDLPPRPAHTLREERIKPPSAQDDAKAGVRTGSQGFTLDARGTAGAPPAAASAAGAPAIPPVPAAKQPLAPDIDAAETVQELVDGADAMRLDPAQVASSVSLLLSIWRHGLGDAEDESTPRWFADWLGRFNSVAVDGALERLRAAASSLPALDDASLNNTLRAAMRYARILSGQHWADTRHVLVALMTPHDLLIPAA